MGSRACLEGSGGGIHQRQGGVLLLRGALLSREGRRPVENGERSGRPSAEAVPGWGWGDICRAPVPAGTLTAPALAQRARSPPWGESPNRTEAQPAPGWGLKRHAPRWPSDTPSPHSSLGGQPEQPADTRAKPSLRLQDVTRARNLPHEPERQGQTGCRRKRLFVAPQPNF